MKKLKTIILTLTVSALSLFTSESYGQAYPEMSKVEHDRKDSLRTAYRLDSLRIAYESKQVKTQNVEDADKMTALTNEKRATKAKAKEAQRVEREATDAARESSDALRAEKKAQKARKQADQQARKAATARVKSNENN